jgi:hypothetical protein
MMTSADLDHNNKLLAVGKKEKLEWVTPKISLMDGLATEGSEKRNRGEELTGQDGTSIGPS